MKSRFGKYGDIKRKNLIYKIKFKKINWKPNRPDLRRKIINRKTK